MYMKKAIVLTLAVATLLLFPAVLHADHAPPGTQLFGFEASLSGSRILAYDIGTNTPGATCMPLPPPANGRGVAYDPVDGNIWYTWVDLSVSPPSDGLIHKVTFPPGCADQGMIPFGDGPGGSIQDDIGALDVDPDDNHIWAAGYEPVSGQSFLYKLNRSTGGVMQSCSVPFGGGGEGNDTLAVAELDGLGGSGKYLLTDAGEPNTPLNGDTLLVIDTASCTGGGSVAPVTTYPKIVGMTGIDYGDTGLIVTDLASIYNLGNPPFGAIQATMSASPADFLEDITLIDREADLAVTKTVDNATPTVGDNVTYTITVENLGPDDTTGVEVTDALPAGVTYVSDTGGGDYSGGVWSVGSLADGATATLEITASVDAGTCDTIITNTASVTASDLADPDDANNSDSADIDVQCADLAVTKSVDNAMPGAGDTIVFTVSVENLGPDDTTGVELTDVLPAGLTHVSDTGGGAYDPVSGVWTVGALNAGDTETLEVTAMVDADACAMTLTNTAEVTASDLADPDPANNGSSVDVTVIAEFGDAETPYPEAYHCDFGDEWLGPGVDGEAAMDRDMDTVDSDGDGVDGDAYDDGVFPKRYYLTNSLVRLPIWVSTSGEGVARYGRAADERLYVQGWIDLDGDGAFSAIEEVFRCNVAPWTAGDCNGYRANWYNGYQTSQVFEARFNVPTTTVAPPGWTWMRVRLSYGQPVGPTDESTYGEVEDYEVGIFKGADP
jgi:uncharacterized repeat protein (TIGR01451 family)